MQEKTLGGSLEASAHGLQLEGTAAHTHQPQPTLSAHVSFVLKLLQSFRVAFPQLNTDLGSFEAVAQSLQEDGTVLLSHQSQPHEFPFRHDISSEYESQVACELHATHKLMKRRKFIGDR